MTMVQSGRPSHGHLTRRVWEIADDLLQAKGQMPRGREVVDAYIAEDPSRSEGTAFTQYSHWKRAQAERSAAQTEELRLGEDGSVRLPAAVIEALGISPGTRLVADLDGRSVRLEPVSSAVERARALVRAFDAGTGSPVDDLIADRRAEAEA